MEVAANSSEFDVFCGFDEFLLSLAQTIIPIVQVIGEFYRSLPSIVKILVSEFLRENGDDQTYIQVVKERISQLSPFDQFVGPRLHEARESLGSRYLTSKQYMPLALDIDAQAWRPLDHLEGKFRAILCDWNQKNPRRAIHTFQAALNPQNKKSGVLGIIRRGILKRFYRAEDRYKEARICPQ